MSGTMEHYRCFHCKQIFGPELARQHFGDRVADLPECLSLAKSGAGGGPHDAYLRIRKDELVDLVSTLEIAKGQMWGRHINADLHAEVKAILDKWRWVLSEFPGTSPERRGGSR